jgi:hypothetical protein
LIGKIENLPTIGSGSAEVMDENADIITQIQQ